MEPDEFARYEAIAQDRGVSFSELIRGTLEEKFPTRKRNPRLAAQRIIGMNVPLGQWEELDLAIALKSNAVLT